jgi:hypothetical protein
MKRTLGTLLVTAALLTGCGSHSSSTATDPSTAVPNPNASVDFTPLGLISQTGGGGQVSAVASPLDTDAQVAAFVAQFRAPSVASRIRHLLNTKDHPPGTHVVGAVVAVGCDVPPGVDVTHGTDQVQIIPKEVDTPLPECLAPVTTVAVVAVPVAG